MTETTRIRWEPTEYGGWTGHVGNIDPPLFNLRRRRVAWVLTAVIPGTSYRIIRDDAAHSIPPVTELQAEAERWLTGFVSSLGAVFPGEPERPSRAWHADWMPVDRDSSGNAILRHKPTGGMYKIMPVEEC